MISIAMSEMDLISDAKTSGFWLVFGLKSGLLMERIEGSMALVHQLPIAGSSSHASGGCRTERHPFRVNRDLFSSC